MSSLERKTARLIGPMMSDIAMPLGADDQFTLAHWIVKTAMVNESLMMISEERFYSQAERKGVMEGKLPECTLVWLARYSGNMFPVFSKAIHFTYGGFPEAPGFISGCNYTFSVGYFAIQVVTYRIGEGHGSSIHLCSAPLRTGQLGPRLK